jgi:hypothetical protein
MVRTTLVAALCLATPAAAQQIAMFSSPGRPLIEWNEPGDVLERAQTASLFAGSNGLFARRALPEIVPEAGYRTDVAGLRDLIAKAEAGPLGHDAVQYRARIKPPKPPTRMTVGEIFAWIRATPRQPHAIGRYQIIPSTLRHLVAELGVPENAVFDVALQDRMADRLLEQAGLSAFLAGEMDRVAFMNSIARVWAGFPTSKGRSYYHGYAGNKAVLSWATFDAEMRRIFPG